MTDLLLKGGEVIDPSQDIRAKLDVAVTDGVISAVAPDINPSGAARVINVNGNIVIPGMIDLHTHVYEGINQNGINPDLAGVRSGVTTVLDAGSAGCYTFGGFPQLRRAERQDQHLLHAAHLAGGLELPAGHIAPRGH